MAQGAAERSRRFQAVEWRERPHDDLVLAVASAAWQAERQRPGFFFAVVSADRPVEPIGRLRR